MTIIDLTRPTPVSIAKVGRERKQCTVDYGSQKCGKPAKWRVVMACCGHNDFLCNPCLEMGQHGPAHPKPGEDYYGCEGCSTLHPTWKSAVKEVIKL